MILELDTLSVAKCISYISKITSRAKKGADPLFTYMQLRIRNGMLSFIATDKQYSVLVNYGAVGATEDLACMIEVEGVKAITNYATAATLKFDFQERKVIIHEGKNKYNLQFYSPFVDFSYIFDTFKIDTVFPIKCAAGELNKIFKFLEPCIAQDVARSFLRGVYYDGNFVATDSINCGVHPFSTEKTSPFFLIKDGLDLFTAFDNDEVIELSPINNMIVVRNIQTTYLFPQLNATFPDYTKITNICQTLPNVINLQRLPLQVACSKLLPFTDSYQRQVAKVTFTDEEILINCYHSKKEANEFVAITDGNLPDKGHTIFLDLKSLTPLVNAIPGDTISIHFSVDNRIPIKITNNNDYTVYISKLQRREEE